MKNGGIIVKRKYMSILVAGAMVASCLSGCTGVSTKKDDGKIKIVTTIFPEYDWVTNVLGDKADDVDVTMLLDNGVDLHSYQCTAEDIMKISDCDMFIYVGGESDTWVDDALKEATNKDMVVINLMDVLEDSVKEEEMVEGMQDGEHNHDHEEGEEHEHEHEEAEEGEEEYDEHVWLSIRNAVAIVESIEEGLEKIDSENAETYKANADVYVEKLNELDGKYTEAVENAEKDTILFGDRFPFRYMVDDYGLNYYAAFSGCSAETEASFKTITFLAGKVDELGLKAVLTIENSDQTIAKTIIENTETKDQEILTLDSMQSTTSKDVENGVTYLSIMESNLEVLKEALK